MRYDVVVVGGGTAGSVLAARLSENPDRSVCLLEAGPDYGHLADGRWPAEILDAREMPWTHGWGPGDPDDGRLGARIIGGCSSHNACVVLSGSPGDYDEWGPGWNFESFAPFIERARKGLRTQPRNTDDPGPLHVAFVEGARSLGFPLLADPDDPSAPVGVAPYPANVVDGTRCNAAIAYLDPARERSNLTILGEATVDRVILEGSRASGVVRADGQRVEAEAVILAAGAYFSPLILCRSGIGPENELSRLGIRVVESLPVGERLLDHCGIGIDWTMADPGHDAVAPHEAEHGLYESHLVIKAASTHCAAGSWDLHFMPWVGWNETTGRQEPGLGLFHVKPLSTGSVRLRSADPSELPLVERGFLSDDEDLDVLLEGVEIARSLAATNPLRDFVGAEVAPGERDPAEYVRETVSNYFHPAGTCALGSVVDTHGRVFGVDGVYVADASFMPTIPRANTNLTTAAIAERIAADLA